MNRSRLNPMSAARKATLAARGVRFPASTFLPRQREPKSKAHKPTLKTKAAARKEAEFGVEFDDATVDAMLERDGFDCAVCGGGIHGVRGRDWSAHHRKLRSQGGDGRLSNGVIACGDGVAGCHGKIHNEVRGARDNGWLVDRDEDPALKPVPHFLHGLVFLDDEGRYSRRRPSCPDDLHGADGGPCPTCGWDSHPIPSTSAPPLPPPWESTTDAQEG